MQLADLENRFAYHAPRDEPTKEDHEFVRIVLMRAAHQLDHRIPDDSREKSLAITKLEEAMFWANAAIARRGTRPSV